MTEEIFGRTDRFEAVDHLSRRLSRSIVAMAQEAEKDVAVVKANAIATLRNKGFALLAGGKTRSLTWKTRPSPMEEEAQKTTTDRPEQSPETQALGSLAVVQGPGKGKHFFLSGHVTRIGRIEEGTKDIRLNFGDDSVSRFAHATVYFDDSTVKFGVQDGGKANPICVNGQPLQGMTELQTGDYLTVGETLLRFTAFCGADFSWKATEPVPAE